MFARFSMSWFCSANNHSPASQWSRCWLFMGGTPGPSLWPALVVFVSLPVRFSALVACHIPFVFVVVVVVDPLVLNLLCVIPTAGCWLCPQHAKTIPPSTCDDVFARTVPLYLAAENGHAKVVQCLLQAKADKETSMGQPDLEAIDLAT